MAGRGAIVGIVTALVALGVAQLVAAGLASPAGAPVNAVGALSINHTPAAVKTFAISAFGSSDKTVLVWGIRIVLIAFAAGVGMLAIRRLAYGLAGLAVFTAIGVYAALIQASATAADALPSLVGGCAGAVALWCVSRLARRGGIVQFDEAPDSGGTTDGGCTGRGRRPAEPEEPAPAGADPGPDRRRFLVASVTVAAGSLVAYGGGSWLGSRRDVSAAASTLRLPAPASPAPPLPPGTDLNIPGLASFITPNASFYRVDTALVLPEVLPSQWHLRIHGMVRRELVLTFDDLIRRPLIEDYITLCCVSNPVGGPYIGNAKWLGASLRSLLQEAGVQSGADQLLCTSTDGFTSGVPVVTAMDGRDALVAVAMNGVPLPVAHGFPARLVIPGLYGYVSACKWVTDIEVTTYSAVQAYWVPRGWAPQGPVKTESRIDVPTGQIPVHAGSTVAIAGEAWAQHKGIEAVEVRIGNGPWQQARLAAVPGIDTWRQWVYDWHVTAGPGNYLVEARATDKTGYTQTSLAAPPEPNGASGYPSVLVNVVS